MTNGPSPAAPASPHIMTLIVASSIGPMAMNIFLPSLPGMTAYFETEYALVQLTVSLYLAATAILQLGIGPASDRFGRRPVMLFSLGIFLLGSLGAIYAPTIEALLLARVLQAFAVAGVVLSRAIIRDTVGPDKAASRIGYTTMGMAVVPMIVPAIGGLLDEIYGWQASFVLIFIAGCLTFAIVYFTMPETNERRSSSMVAQLRTYPELFRSRRFWGYALSTALASGAFFSFLGGGPFVATEIFGLRPVEYGLYFALLSFGYMMGNFCSGRLSARIGIDRMMMAGAVLGTLGIVIGVLVMASGVMHPLALFLPVSVMGMGNGLVLPNATAGLVSARPHLAGSASGLGGALQIGIGATLSVLAGALLSPTSGPWPLMWVMLGCSIASMCACLYVMRLNSTGT